MANDTFALPPSTILVSEKRNYKVVKVLGSGGFGVTYLAKGKIKVDNVWVEGFFAIKELFPSDFSHRVNCQILPNQGHEEELRKAKADFLLEASRLQSIGTLHDNIVKVNEVFEANGTAYYVMQYVNGRTLYEYVTEYGGLQFDFAYKLISPIMQAVEFLHQSRINHFDIKPDNVMLQMADDEIQPVLIDFGLSIHYKNDGNKTTARAFGGVSEGYAPMEQYADIKHFSPPTDVYALAATIVFMLTGTQPAPAPVIRIPELRQLLLTKVPEHVADALCHAMSHIDQRTQTVAQLRDELTGAAVPPSFAPQPQKWQQPQQSQQTWQQPRQDWQQPQQPAREQQTEQGGFRPTQKFDPTETFPGGFPNPETAYPAAGDSQVYEPVEEREPIPVNEKKEKKGGMPAWIWAVVGVVVLGAVFGVLVATDIIKLGGDKTEDTSYVEDLENIVNNGDNDSEGEGTQGEPATAAGSTAAQESQSQESGSTGGSASSQGGASSASQGGASGTSGGSSTGGQAAAQTPRPTTGTVAWNGNGKYTGKLVNGKPDGHGRIDFTGDGIVDRRIGTEVHAGYFLEGDFSEGKISAGVLYDDSGSRVASIVP